MTALDLLQQLHEHGVILTPSPDGTVRCRALKSVLTPDLLDVMRQHKAALHALVETRVLRDQSPPAEPLTQYYPCIVCGSTDRWDDHGIWRCVACWPSPERQG